VPKSWFSTLVAGGQISGFSDWPRNKKQRKKRSTLKTFFIHRSKLQTWPQRISINRRDSASQTHKRVFRPIGTAKTAGVPREEAETRTGICVLSFFGNSKL
jgi:hypothetical protein